MNRSALVVPLILVALLGACKKREPEPAVPAAPAAEAPAPAQPAAAAAAEPTAEQRELAHKQALLAFATREDKFINDPRAQWAAEAKASSVFGDKDKSVSDSNKPQGVVGPADGRNWTNDNIDKGFDWLETTYANPVNATEVRVVITSGQGVEAISKVELQDTEAKWHTVWEGLSDVKKEENGNRTWFVRTFDKTAYKARAVKVTFANNLQHDYKTIDAVQLVGDQ